MVNGDKYDQVVIFKHNAKRIIENHAQTGQKLHFEISNKICPRNTVLFFSPQVVDDIN